MTDFSRREATVAAGALAVGWSAAGSAQSAPITAPRRAFTSGELWLDTAGKPIQAHGGSIIQVGEVF